MTLNPKLQTEGEGYKKIFEQNQRDAYLYKMSERICMIAGIGAVISLGIALLRPLTSSWLGLTDYLFQIVILPLPFITVIGFAALVHRKIAKKYHV